MSINDESTNGIVDSISKFGSRHVQILLIFTGVAIYNAELLSVSVAVISMTDTTNVNSKFQTYNWDSQIKAYILSSAAWSFLITQIPAGIIIDKFISSSIHKLVCVSIFIGSVFNILIPLSAKYLDWGGVVACGMFMGIVQSFILPCAHTFLIRWAPIEERSSLGSLIVYAPNFGNIINLLVSGMIVNSDIGWPGILYVFGGLGILWSLLFYFFGVNFPSEHPSISTKEKSYIERSQTFLISKKKEAFPWKSIITSIPMWTLVLNHISQGCYLSLLLCKLPAYINSVLHFSIQDSAFLSVLPYITEFSCMLPIIWLCDYALKKGVEISVIRKVASSIGCWSISVFLLILIAVSSIESQYIAIIIIVIMFGLDSANIPGFNINHMDIAPNYVGFLMAIFYSIESIAGQFFILLAGYIVYDETNADQWNIMFYMISVMYILSNLSFIIFGKFEPEPWNGPTDSPIRELKI